MHMQTNLPSLEQAERAREAERLQALTEQAIADAHAPAPTLEQLADDAGEYVPTDEEIFDVGLEYFGMDARQWVDRLSVFISANRNVPA